ncbi:MAG: hypothetical protein EXR51_07615 [Dehalococcoidia bacterium]|nr:hypothetical protein [Dehalococcoidia bacterium]
MVQQQADSIRMRVQLRQVFTPGAPISHKDSLSGRSKQITQVLEAVGEHGKHAVIFGERGVGKTSLAGLVHTFWTDIMRDSEVLVARVNCEPLDDYAAIWSHIAEEIVDQLGDDLQKPFKSFFGKLYEGDATPHLIRRCFQASDTAAIITIDEELASEVVEIGLRSKKERTLPGEEQHRLNEGRARKGTLWGHDIRWGRTR